MIGYTMVGSNDVARSRRFYDVVMPLFGAQVNTAWSTDTRVWYAVSPEQPMFVVTTPHDGQPAGVGNGSMIALVLTTRQAVDAVHAKALEIGAVDEGGPGHRSDHPDDLYRAYFRDPDGNKLMVFTMERVAA